MRNRPIILLAVSLGLVFFSSHYALAYCPNVPANSDGTDYHISADCTFEGRINGIENGDIYIDSGVTLTVNPGYTVVWNPGHSIHINGTIYIGKDDQTGKTGYLRKGYIYIPVSAADSDDDGWATFGVADQIFGKEEEPPDKYKRRGSLSSKVIVHTEPDCDDSNANIFQEIRGLVTDADQDRYGTSTSGSTQCVGDRDKYWYKDANGNYTYIRILDLLDTSNTDCCDSDPKSHPGANTGMSHQNACGSWDWNCDGEITQVCVYNAGGGVAIPMNPVDNCGGLSDQECNKSCVTDQQCGHQCFRCDFSLNCFVSHEVACDPVLCY